MNSKNLNKSTIAQRNIEQESIDKKVSSISKTEMILSMVFVGILASLFIFGSGFAPSTHDLAHDTRHAIGYPCH